MVYDDEHLPRNIFGVYGPMTRYQSRLAEDLRGRSAWNIPGTLGGAIRRERERVSTHEIQYRARDIDIEWEVPEQMEDFVAPLSLEALLVRVK